MATKCELNTGLSSDPSHTKAPSIDKTTSPKHYRHKRDSGYSTDVSPSSATGKTRHFTFDSDAGDSEIDLNDEIQCMELNNDVFTDESNDSADESDEADKEVEHLFSDSEELREDIVTSNSAEEKLARPAAPIPMCLDRLIEDTQTSSRRCENQSSFCGFDSKGLHQETFFRPISRSLGTPSLQSRNTDGPSEVPRPGFQPYSVCRGMYPLSRPRFQPYSVCRGFSASRGTYQQQSNTEALPDIVPESRDRSSYGWPDRSLSTPEMSSASPWYEQEVARRLRRISDEFDVATETRMTQSPFHRTSSFTVLSLGIMKCIDRVRKYLSPSLDGSQEQS